VKPLTVLSLFDGISCGRVALQRANIPVGKYYASEIDKYAMQVTQKNWPDTVQLGDVKEVWARNLPKIDLLIGGSPCQDLSIAKNNRKGLQGARSGLFWHYVRLLRTCKPKYFLLENVASMPKEAKEIITRELGADPILINSALVSAQQRKRLYWTNIPNITQPEDKGIILSDVLETEGVGVDVENQGRTLCKKVNKGGALMARDYKGFGNQRMTGVAEPMRVPERIGNIQGQKDNTANRIYSVRGKSVSLKANGGGGGAKTGLYKIDLPDGEYVIRKLTPLECERLQTLPDNYTAGISNTQRYKCIGNGWTVDVISHIFSFIPMEDNK
jgi:DNA (cytosine-5)-methyltransferase 3A